MDLAKALAYRPPPCTVTYSERDTILYALGIGEGWNPTDDKNLRFVYERHAEFASMPTMGVLFSNPALSEFIVNPPGVSFNPMMLLHGEHYLEIRSPLPTSGTVSSQAKMSNLYDKGKASLMVVDSTTVDQATGKELCFNQYKFFIRGLGGFGGPRGPAEEPIKPPSRHPDVIHKEKTTTQQALLYRLTGDINPLHADPSFAAVGGFDRPILHGLCTLGHAARAVIHHFLDSNPALFKSIRVRFTKHVFPGDTIITEMWKDTPDRVIFQCKVAEREGLVLSSGVVQLALPLQAKL